MEERAPQMSGVKREEGAGAGAHLMLSGSARMIWLACPLTRPSTTAVSCTGAPAPPSHPAPAPPVAPAPPASGSRRVPLSIFKTISSVVSFPLVSRSGWNQFSCVSCSFSRYS